MHTFSVPLLLCFRSSKKAKGGPRKWQVKVPHLMPCEVVEQAMLEVISRHVKDTQCNSCWVLSGSTANTNTLSILMQHLPTATAGSWVQNQVCKKNPNNKPSNQHQTSFLLFKAGLSTKNHAEEAVFSSKHNQISVQLLTNQGTTSCLSTETAWSRSLACYKTEPCSWLMPKEQQLEQLFH